ncbi:protein of unknown function [Legionella micdadei]|uniref:Uncharacterized protein n=1 Tax=Legionella micdadei TaxID=451 RepID=A0A098GIN6_LEGMI|nr:protein of unknown function [Legionella micdadei]
MKRDLAICINSPSFAFIHSAIDGISAFNLEKALDWKNFN